MQSQQPGAKHIIIVIIIIVFFVIIYLLIFLSFFYYSLLSSASSLNIYVYHVSFLIVLHSFYKSECFSHIPDALH